MAIYAIVNASGNIVNRADADSGWAPGAGLTKILEAGSPFEIGGTYIGGVYTAPTHPDPVPPSVAPSLDLIGIVRFTVAANVVTVTADSIGIGSVLRISAGRYRVYSQNSSPETMLPKVTVLDIAIKNARVRMRTAAYVEVSVVDGSNVAADATEIILELNRIVTS